VYNGWHTRRSRLEPHTARNPNRGNMTGQLPLARAQLLVKRILALRSTSHNNATAMTPTHTNSSLARGNQQDPIHTLRHIARNAFCDSRSRSSCSRRRAAVRARVGGPQRRVPCLTAPRASIPSPQVGVRGVRSGSCVRAREGGGGSATRRLRSRHPSRCSRTDLAEARLAGRGLIPYAHHRKHAG
jgi:hypothetical protein